MAGGFDLVGIGEPLIEFNQTRGGDGRAWLQGFGGDTSNALIAAARQGARTAYFTRIGDDEFGRLCMQLWRDERVDAAFVQVDAEAPTGLYFVTHGPDGHAFTYRRAGSAASLMRPGDLPPDLIRKAKYLHVSGISQAISATAADTVAHAVHAARGSGVKVAYDPNVRLRLWSLERAQSVIGATLPLVDCFLPGIDDMRLICGLDDPDAIIDWCHARGAADVVLKLGARGSVVSDGRTRTAIEPFAVDAVDATGAGDCFDGSLLARLAAGDTLVAAARYASAAAALATTGYGAVAPLPDAARVRAMLAG
ncbi:sugar kinase [Paraburkholderia caballeronis]|uniref:sugar kinase n=1 Tax=Paraburkholderia caballeronis TaxID=416943 RepID=UPI001066565C|nr:sugar kinase [Paraburkholderia caballeronis]TDV16413.1 2-dehydro-3-deoxygluconokinase [Paraburkholderia caballeronis]TDV18809.1 2-dehydro-3-deoxygluconokinase [Paraburkholderia caballeronis]TDV26942.1 2-dehydro-3-deoxygluconokinase [Paraburkholderia caballeronis]